MPVIDAERFRRLQRAVDDILGGWERLGIFSLDFEVRRASLRLSTVLVPESEAQTRRFSESAPLAALLHRLCVDRASFAEVRAQIQALGKDLSMRSLHRTPRLVQLIDEAQRATDSMPSHTSVSLWAFVSRLVADFDMRALDENDAPRRTANGFVAPRGAYVRFGRGTVKLPAPSWTNRAPAIAADETAQHDDVEAICRVPERGTQSILEILRDRYRQTPHALVSTFVDGKGREVRSLSYRELVERALACADSLHEAGLNDGDRVALVYPPDTDEFLVGFFGCLFAGAVAVPCAPPDPRALDVAIPRLAHIIRDCDCRIALTTRLYSGIALAGRAWGRIGRAGAPAATQWPRITWIHTDALSPRQPSRKAPIPTPPASKLAYLQYTSGSTSVPRGVMVHHGNILHNVEAIRRQATMTPRSVLVGWVPLFHDMGLVGGLFNAIYCGARLVFFSPLAFLQNPRLWLETIHKYRGTHTESPNFAYEFLLRSLEGDSLEGMDLSCLTHALFGGEVMRVRTFERMAERLHKTGFRPEAMCNILGAAEATLFLAGGSDGYPPFLSVETALLEFTGRAVPCSPDEHSSTLLGCQIPPDACELRIVNPHTLRPMPDLAVGEIWLSSPSTSQGYWGHPPDENDTVFRARMADESSSRTYLRTGDLGFIDRGVLYICGRRKERMLLDGRHIFSSDLEISLMNAHRAIRQGCVAAFSVEEQGLERLVVVAELKASAVAQADAAAQAIAVALAVGNALSRSDILLVRSGALPKTSSGKLQRYKVRERYLSGQLKSLHARA